jgi:hypothetical protein
MMTDQERDRLLMRWANLEWVLPAESQVETADMFKRYPEVFAELVGAASPLNVSGWFYWVGQHLRAAWDSQDERHREWYLFKVSERCSDIILSHRAVAAGTVFHKHPEGTGTIDLQPGLKVSGGTFDGLGCWGSEVNPPPTRSGFEELIAYFHRRLRMAMHCPREGCRTPYFFRTGRRDKFCSDPCARMWHSEYQRSWWHEKGKLKRQAKRGQTGRRGRPRKSVKESV